MRAWFDGYDVNGNDNFSDNPAAGAAIGTWADKSGIGNDVSHPLGFRQPTLKTLSTNYGVKFNGGQRLFRTGDIWAGTVDDVDIFAAVSTDVRTASWLVSSASSATNAQHRIGTHTPWSNGTTYWDRGTCCGTSRLSGNIPISIGTETKYLWNFYASSNSNNAPFSSKQSMYVMQNGNNSLSSNKSDSYTPTATAVFALGAQPNADTSFFNGTLGETIVYQRTLNLAERNIINSYLFARWKTPGTLNNDQYAGDTMASYYYHVGGIGRSSGGSVTTGTSRGLTITRLSGGNNRYLLAGLKDLTPATGTVTTDVPATVGTRAARDWYFDRSPNNGSDSNMISFDLAAMGITAADGDEYALLFRSSTATDFEVLQDASVAGGTLSYEVKSPDDGFYTIGKVGAVVSEPEFTVKKDVTIDNDPINGGANPKTIPNSVVVYSVTVSNAAVAGSNTENTFKIQDTLDESLSFFTGDFDGNGSPIQFVEGTPSCDLSFNFASYADINDDMTFYDGAGNPVTSITPDVDGYDANIRSIEITPQGSFAVMSGTTEPFCEFKYKARVQ